ncbi:hypothetical protein [Foetidibacter luteolus]|uniref:hypothetical protein n=1 Tax=Foetidibacter luteolus TaxID=2608880 RepID=UPI00129A9179|nr:hypothetical protein [Foetidibacter luteolus]
MIEIVQNYLLLKKQLPQLIKKSGYRNDFIAEKIGMKADYFAVKKQRNSWSDEEILKIIKLIESDDVSEYFDSLLIKKAFPGKTVSSEEFEKQMGW